MALITNDLEVVWSSHGLDAGKRVVEARYSTNDLAATVETDGYFDLAADKLGQPSTGWILADGDIDGTPFTKWYRFTAAAGDVALTAGASYTGFSDQPFVAFTSTDATPSVAGARNFVTANASPTTITAFDNGTVGQEIFVKAGDANTTIDFTGTTLKGNAGVDKALVVGDAILGRFDGTNWFFLVIDGTT